MTCFSQLTTRFFPSLETVYVRCDRSANNIRVIGVTVISECCKQFRWSITRTALRVRQTKVGLQWHAAFLGRELIVGEWWFLNEYGLDLRGCVAVT
jgi:hypothetical protein